MPLNSRTDLAYEAHSIRAAGTSLPGVKVEKSDINGISLTSVEILDAEGSSALKKPPGQYFSLLLDTHYTRGSDSFAGIADAISQLIRRCYTDTPVSTVLVAALGNPDITPDALGSIAASSVLVTRHLKLASSPEFKNFNSVALCRTGVLGTTGLESAAQIGMLCRELGVDLVIAVDALAAAEADCLCKTIQICDAGISPGSGVGNNRQSISRSSLGVPVIAVGVPTVIDASSLSESKGVAGMFVTPRSIDSDVRALGRLIAYGINLALHPQLSVLDIDALIG